MLEITFDAVSVIRTYDRYARFYDLVFGAVLNHGRKTLARVLNASAGERILEIGVGSGLMLPLYPRNVQVLGIDLSAKMLQRARATIARHRLEHVHLQLVDAEITRLPPAAFDHVVLPYVYSVTPHPLLLMRQAFRLCKPGGSVWILNHFSQSAAWGFLERPLRIFPQSIGFRTDFPYKTYVADQNWEIIAEYKVNLFSLSRLVHVRNGERGDRK
jgi:phosphatidylethanolamine/phosphatidyl-N-methylethanolamine N-methyltransferase